MRQLWMCLTWATCTFAQAVEHPIPQPNSYGWAFAGPALALECVGVLRPGNLEFREYFAAKSRAERRVCLDQLMQSLTPEPDFTADDFFKTISSNRNRNLSPADVDLGRRMGGRIGVNLRVAQAVESIATADLIDDPVVLRPLIRCLDHPLIEISASCQRTLFALTRHDFVRPFNDFRIAPKTIEARRRLIRDWEFWHKQMEHGHPLVDERLRSTLLSCLDDVFKGLAAVLNNAYVTHAAKTKPQLDQSGRYLFSWYISRDIVAGGWHPNVALAAVGVRAFRPGLPDYPQPDDSRNPNPETTYRERLPFLDLEVQVTIATADVAQRDRCLRVARESLASLRRANQMLQR